MFQITDGPKIQTYVICASGFYIYVKQRPLVAVVTMAEANVEITGLLLTKVNVDLL